MHTLDQNGGLGGYGDRKPSKLEQMRADYQKKLMKEKEEKMVHLYEENQRKAMMRLTKNGHAGNGDQYSNGAGSPMGGKSVREFFNERRRLEAAGAHVPNIDQHYKQTKGGYASPGGWSSRTGSGNSVTKGSHLMHGSNKNSAGRDRAQPLAPIQRRSSLATETTGNNNVNNGGIPGKSGIPLRHHNPQVTANGVDNPFNGRPALFKHQPLPPTANGNAAQGRTPQQPSSLPRYVHPVKKNQQEPQQQHHYPQQQQQQQAQRQLQQQPQQQQSRQPHPPPTGKQGNPRPVAKQRGFAPKPTPVTNESGSRNGSGKLTDFQKWQLEQNQAREERLKKLDNDNSYNNGVSGQPETNNVDEYENDKENGPRKPVSKNRDRLNRLNGHVHDMDEDDADDDDGKQDEGEDDIPEEDEDEKEDRDSDIKAQERALIEQIAAKQREMESLRKEREQEEEEERREAALRKKREAAERARQKKLDEERRKEEERQRKQEEEEERQERKKEEQRQRDEEKRHREDEKRRREDEKRRQEEERKAAKRQAEEEKRFAKKQQHQQQQYSPRKGPSASDHNSCSGYDDETNSPDLPSSRHPNAHDTFRARSGEAPPIDEKPVAIAGNDASFYSQAAFSSDARGSVGSLAPCKQCGRKFAQDRLKKHQDACVKANKPRKEFNAAMKRVEGTEMAKYAGKNRKPDPPKKKSNWRAKHEEFIQSLRYAKKVTEYEKEGKDLRELAPPPPTQNPDLVPCPHCGRTFNETAAERHIPRCKELKTRPPPMNTRRR